MLCLKAGIVCTASGEEESDKHATKITVCVRINILYLRQIIPKYERIYERFIEKNVNKKKKTYHCILLFGIDRGLYSISHLVIFPKHFLESNRKCRNHEFLTVYKIETFDIFFTHCVNRVF